MNDAANMPKKADAGGKQIGYRSQHGAQKQGKGDGSKSSRRARQGSQRHALSATLYVTPYCRRFPEGKWNSAIGDLLSWGTPQTTGMAQPLNLTFHL